MKDQQRWYSYTGTQEEKGTKNMSLSELEHREELAKTKIKTILDRIKILEVLEEAKLIPCHETKWYSYKAYCPYCKNVVLSSIDIRDKKSKRNYRYRDCQKCNYEQGYEIPYY
jgi:formate dehydrogenase maturation protein FdhE